MLGETPLGFEVVVADVGMPIQGVSPAVCLHPLVGPPARVRRNHAAAQQVDEHRELVRLRVVDVVARAQRERERCARVGAFAEAADRARHHFAGVQGERLLRALCGNEGARARPAVDLLEELEAARRLDIGELEVGEMDEPHEAVRPWPEGARCRIRAPHETRFARSVRQPPVGASPTPAANRPSRDDPFEGRPGTSFA